MKIIMRRVIFFLVLVWLPWASFADVVADLYQATVPVASRSEADFQKGLSNAYLQVLLKTSGNPTIANVPGIAQSPETLNNIVQRYTYAVQTSSDNVPQLVLTVNFDPSSIRQILQNAGQVFWGDHRPLSLLWIAYQSQNGISILTSDSSDPLVANVKNTAQQFALPVLLPLMDLQAMSVISPQDVWNLTPAVLQRASLRYHVTNIIAGKIYSLPEGNWQGDWLAILDNNQPIQWQNQGASVQQVIQLAIGNLANTLAQRYATTTTQSSQTQLTLQINQVSGLNQYLAVMQYLKNLPIVRDVKLIAVQAQDLIVQITIAGSEQDFMQAIQQDQKLISTSGPSSDGTLSLDWGAAQPAATPTSTSGS